MPALSTTRVFWENKAAYDSGLYRAICNEGSTRSSKTYSVAQLNCATALQVKKEITVCSPSLPHLKRGARKDYLDILKSMGVYNDRDFNKTDNIYRIPSTGSYIEFFGADEEGKLRGPGRDILHINEANLITFQSYTQLALRTRGTVFTDYNPADDYSWVYDVADREGNKMIHSTYADNRHNLTPFQVREIEALKDADENLWKVYGLGLRGTSSETIYTHWQIIDHFPECDEIVYGLDFGFQHPNVLVKIGFKFDKQGICTAVYVEQMIYEKGLTNSDLAYAIKVLGVTKKSPIYCDSARPEAIEEIKRFGLNALPAVKDVFEGIKQVKSQPLFFTKNSTDLIKEAKSYKWMVDPVTKKPKKPEQPVKFLDDGMDATRYGIYTRLFKPKKKFADAEY